MDGIPINRLLPFLCALLFVSCNRATVSSGEARPAVGQSAALTNYPVADLRAVKAGYDAGKREYVAAIAEVIGRADKELTGEVYTIVNKEVLPPSGDPHDYLSLAPYWWPDPEKPDGLPWIRRDGEVNPVTRGENTDKSQQNAFSGAVEALAYAAYFTGKVKYRDRAEELLRAFLLDPATRMNPHLNFAQGIPGVNTGRCFGIIELVDVISLVTSLEVLDLAGGIGAEVKRGADDWLSDYLHWLRSSELGLEEQSRSNNHGTWYDAQVMSLLLHLDRKEEARKVARGVRARIDEQIAADGSQPHELARTKSLSYSTMNLRAFSLLAYLARAVDVDLWGYVAPGGGSIPGAFAYLMPYARGEAEWTGEQLGGAEKVLPELRELFARAGNLFGVTEYCTLAQGTGGTDLEALIHRCQTVD